MRILVVDDEETSRDKVANLLSDYGECAEATDGSAALCLFGHAHGMGKPFDLITMDVEMPNLRGQDVVRAIRNWERRNEQDLSGKKATIVMLTSMTGAGAIFEAYEQSCDDYVVKPITPAKVRASMEKLGIAAACAGEG